MNPEPYVAALGTLVAGILLCWVFIAIIRQAAFRQKQRQFQRSLKPKYEEHG